MKDGVVIVNTARGELINLPDFVEALETGKVFAAGLDVLETEPIEPDNPLLKFPNVYIVPHIGGYGTYSLRKMDEKMVEDIEKLVNGEIPDQIVNPEVISKILETFQGKNNR
jgi:Lactate dehydrogenase and related dehydrogenases